MTGDENSIYTFFVYSAFTCATVKKAIVSLHESLGLFAIPCVRFKVLVCSLDHLGSIIKLRPADKNE